MLPEFYSSNLKIQDLEPICLYFCWQRIVVQDDLAVDKQSNPTWNKGFVSTQYYEMLCKCYKYSSKPQGLTLQRKSHLCIPFLGKARPQPQFQHSCVCERCI